MEFCTLSVFREFVESLGKFKFLENIQSADNFFPDVQLNAENS